MRLCFGDELDGSTTNSAVSGTPLDQRLAARLSLRHPVAMALPSPCASFQTSWCNHINGVSAEAWNALAGTDNPFLRHEFLHGLESTGCLDPRWGWTARHLLLHNTRNGALVGAMPCYRKDNSFGEFVFDFAWAQAYLDAGLNYYPKLLCGVPHTPVTGARMLVASGAASASVRHALAGLDRCVQRTVVIRRARQFPHRTRSPSPDQGRVPAAPRLVVSLA